MFTVGFEKIAISQDTFRRARMNRFLRYFSETDPKKDAMRIWLAHRKTRERDFVGKRSPDWRLKKGKTSSLTKKHQSNAKLEEHRQWRVQSNQELSHMNIRKAEHLIGQGKKGK